LHAGDAKAQHQQSSNSSDKDEQPMNYGTWAAGTAALWLATHKPQTLY
jgi:hypothetical protein